MAKVNLHFAGSIAAAWPWAVVESKVGRGLLQLQSAAHLPKSPQIDPKDVHRSLGSRVAPVGEDFTSSGGSTRCTNSRGFTRVPVRCLLAGLSVDARAIALTPKGRHGDVGWRSVSLLCRAWAQREATEQRSGTCSAARDLRQRHRQR